MMADMEGNVSGRRRGKRKWICDPFLRSMNIHHFTPIQILVPCHSKKENQARHY